MRNLCYFYVKPIFQKHYSEIMKLNYFLFALHANAAFYGQYLPKPLYLRKI